MLTQKTIKGWLPGVNAVFRYHLPLLPVQYPDVHLATAKTFPQLRKQIIKDTGCRLKGIPDDSCMEYIHGRLGGAILIRMNQLPPKTDFDAFIHFYWHELGHFYSINADKNNLERFNDLDSPPEEEADYDNVLYKQRGYWFWSEFIAEAISNYISYKFRSSDPDNPSSTSPNYRPDEINWKAEIWGCMVDRLMNFLDYAFVWCYGVDEYSLAMYFATLLTDDFCKLYVNAAREGKLKMYGKATPEKPGTIEPTCISDRPKVFQPFLWKMKELLEGQLKKKEFWITDEATLEKLGRFIYELVKAKKKL